MPAGADVVAAAAEVVAAADGVCAAVESGSLPEVAVIGQRDGLLIAVVGDHGQHRLEDLLLRDPRGVVDVGEHRRLDKPAARLVKRNIAAHNEFRAAAFTFGDVAHYPFTLPGAHHRADVGCHVQRVADSQSADQLGQRVDHLASSATAAPRCVSLGSTSGRC